MVCCVYAESLSHVCLIANPWTITCQAPLSMEFSRQECWSGFSLHCSNGLVTFWFSSVQLLNRVWLFVTPWTAANQASLFIINFRSLLKLKSIQPSPPLLSPSPPAFNLPQHHGLFQWASSSHQVAKVLEFQLQHQSSGLISFKIDCCDLLAVQGTLKSLLQHIVQKHHFFSAQLPL